MAEAPQTLRHQIIAKRYEIDQDIEQIQRLLTRRVEEMTDWKRPIRNYPFGFVIFGLLLGLGMGWLTAQRLR